MSDYETLVAYGHSPAKAAEIVLDASRGDAYAKAWIARVTKNVNSRQQAHEAATAKET